MDDAGNPPRTAVTREPRQVWWASLPPAIGVVVALTLMATLVSGPLHRFAGISAVNLIVITDILGLIVIAVAHLRLRKISLAERAGEVDVMIGDRLGPRVAIPLSDIKCVEHVVVDNGVDDDGNQVFQRRLIVRRRSSAPGIVLRTMQWQWRQLDQFFTESGIAVRRLPKPIPPAELWRRTAQ